MFSSLNGACFEIADLINHYPKVSHSFIRREILALERQGFHIERLALDCRNGPLPDEEDRQEQAQTRYVLRRGGWSLLLPALRVMFCHPARFFVPCASRSGWLANLIDP